MKRIAIYGAGGFGREVACLIREINGKNGNPSWKFEGFFDDGIMTGTENEYGKILGGIDALNDYPVELSVVMAIGKPQTLSKVVGLIKRTDIVFPNISAPDLRLLDRENMSMGFGNIFFSKCSLSCNVRVGNFNIFNGSIAIGHDVVIGDFNTFMPGTRISGEVNIGSRNLFGIYSVVLQQKKIGIDTTIGTGSVVIRNTQDNSTYFGNPAKRLEF